MSRTNDVLRSIDDSATLSARNKELRMRYLLAVNFDGGVIQTPMEEWTRQEKSSITTTS